MENLDDHLLLYIANCMPLPVCARALRATCRAARRAIPPIPKCMAHKMVVLAACAGVRDVCEEACERGAVGLARAMGCEVDDVIRAEWMQSVCCAAVLHATQYGHDDIARMIYERSVGEQAQQCPDIQSAGARSAQDIENRRTDIIYAWINGAMAGGRVEFAEELREKHGVSFENFISYCHAYIGRSGNIAFIRKIMQTVDRQLNEGTKAFSLSAIARGTFGEARAVCDAVFEELARLRYNGIVALRLELSIARDELGVQFDGNFINEKTRNYAAFLAGCSGKQKLCEHVRELIGSRADDMMLEGAMCGGCFRLFCWLVDAFPDLSGDWRERLLNNAMSNELIDGHLEHCIELRARGARLTGNWYSMWLCCLSPTYYYMVPEIIAWARADGVALVNFGNPHLCIDRVFMRALRSSE